MIDLLQECMGAKVIGITGHIRPDGDCVGSCMALYLYLQNRKMKNTLKNFLPKCNLLFPHKNIVIFQNEDFLFQ